MSGRLVAVLGPSGVGKDSVLGAIRDRRPDVLVAQRVITRPAEAGGEPFEGVCEDTFRQRLDAGNFALHWQAHGLRYGVPVSIDDHLAMGKTVFFNGSRGELPAALARYPRMQIILLIASPEVLARRLLDRGRETLDDIAARLKRADYSLPAQINATTILNDGALDDTVDQVLATLQLESISL